MTQTFSPDVARQAAQMIAADHTLGRVAFPCHCSRCVGAWRPLFAADPWGPRLLPFVVRVGHA